MIMYLPSPVNENENYFITLEGIQYEIFLSYQESFDFWTIKLIRENEPFIQTTTLVQGVDVGYNTLKPDDFGRLYISTLSGDLSDPNKDNFGSSVFLTYETSDGTTV